MLQIHLSETLGSFVALQWGMPRAALLTGAVETETALSAMAGAITAAARGKHQER